MIRVDTILIRTNTDTGYVTAIIYTPENDLVSGSEGMGASLHEALYDLATTIEEVGEDAQLV